MFGSANSELFHDLAATVQKRNPIFYQAVQLTATTGWHFAAILIQITRTIEFCFPEGDHRLFKLAGYGEKGHITDLGNLICVRINACCHACLACSHSAAEFLHLGGAVLHNDLRSILCGGR
jgi:hypothetical protein